MWAFGFFLAESQLEIQVTGSASLKPAPCGLLGFFWLKAS
jgi:hypothetical protein